MPTPSRSTRKKSTPTGVVVFDMDGVLVDVRASFRQAIGLTVAALGGGEVGADEIQALKNSGGFNNDWDLSRELLRQRGRDVPRPEVIDVFNGFYLGPKRDGEGGLILRETWLLTEPALRQLARRCALAVFTGRPRADAEFTLRHFGVREQFAALVALEDVTEQKPHPDGLEQLRRQFAPLPVLAYLGDTVDDARCAAAAGIAFIGILHPDLRQRDDLARLFAAVGCQFTAPNVDQAVSRLAAAPGDGAGA
ncbi:MAG TPA: HAD family hydrolase [Terriglobales bacterium]|nr:HAD family hydrolase [Terriglobales bacterium]